ncbi:MAG: isoaspartyl peptidase/L-asparaginase [Chitinophagaceae bacterium]|nr:isoaspartyl peptidase/L-asparaginase [Chitinophagaceae bacterium]
MRKLFVLFSLFFFIQGSLDAQNDGSNRYVLVIHGGAGTIQRSQMSPEREKAYHDALQEALAKGEEILKNGGSALDAVEASVKYMEDNPLFNAGKGAVFTSEGTNELDAAIMDGRNLAAGAVASVKVIRHPISAARVVMEKSPHVLMVGAGAELYARQGGLEIVDPSYFFTEDRWNGLQRLRVRDSIEQQQKKDGNSTKRQIDEMQKELQSLEAELAETTDRDERFELLREIAILHTHIKAESHEDKFGTVGAVALDKKGNLAAATSTGGMANKKFGRIGDAPIIGAGTYANNQTAAISGTGWGEFFIRLVLAKTISDMMEFGKMSLADAADEMVMKRLPALGGDGGVIAVDKNGNIALPFSTSGMYRGYVKEGEKRGDGDLSMRTMGNRQAANGKRERRMFSFLR